LIDEKLSSSLFIKTAIYPRKPKVGASRRQGRDKTRRGGILHFG